MYCHLPLVLPYGPPSHSSIIQRRHEARSKPTRTQLSKYINRSNAQQGKFHIPHTLIFVIQHFFDVSGCFWDSSSCLQASQSMMSMQQHARKELIMRMKFVWGSLYMTICRTPLAKDLRRIISDFYLESGSLHQTSSSVQTYLSCL